MLKLIKHKLHKLGGPNKMAELLSRDNARRPSEPSAQQRPLSNPYDPPTRNLKHQVYLTVLFTCKMTKFIGKSQDSIQKNSEKPILII